MLSGEGGNGKSFYMKHFKALLGDKWGVIDLEGMAGTGFDRSNAISLLQGKLVAQAPEIDLSKNPKFISHLKKIATGDTMVARTIGGNSYNFESDSVLFMDTNSSVELGDSDAIMRRLIGISFVNRKLSWDEMDPFAKWVTTIDGAASLFLYAYGYYADECESKFYWNSINVNLMKRFSINTDDPLQLLAESYVDLGCKRAFIDVKLIEGMTRSEKEHFMAMYGCRVSSKRLNNRVIRALMIDDEEQFVAKCKEKGFLS